MILKGTSIMDLVGIFLGLDGKNVQGEAFLTSFPLSLH